jgi:hypothetical protein
MSLRSAALTGLLVIGTATAAVAVSGPASPASAATTACGYSCISLMSEQYGLADFLAAGPAPISIFGSSGAGRSVVLAAAGPDASEDWQNDFLGTASFLASAGIVTAQVGRTWPDAQGFEYQYTPDGRPSGLCLGVAGPAGISTPVTLQPCGTPFDTVWVKIAKNRLGRYGPLVSGTDTQTIVPFVLTTSGPGNQLTTEFLVPRGSRLYLPDQLWGNWFGPY